MRMTRLTGAVTALAATALLTVAGTGIAAASGGHPAAAARTTVCTRLWAVVAASGRVVRAGCRGTHAARETTGGYLVTFQKRNVLRCAWVATLGLAGTSGTPAAGEIGVSGDQLFQGVFVNVFNISGIPVNEGFHLIVNC